MKTIIFKSAKRSFTIFALIVAILSATVLPIYAWFFLEKNVAFYAPISSPEALYIGAGHKDIFNDEFEDIRYLYFDELDASSDIGYSDYVFCVYGKAVNNFRLQLAYTTNNQFTYSLYYASEMSQDDFDELTTEEQKEVLSTSVKYVTHSETPETYYYSVNGPAIEGDFLNKVDGLNLGAKTNGMHGETYSAYPASSVNDYSEPIYWQTSNNIAGNLKGGFVEYFILRISLNGKNTNDRETDILCIAAKSFA